MAVGSLEEVIEQMGAFGPFQSMVLIILNLAETPCAWAILLMAFAGAKPEWTCHNATDITNETYVITTTNASSYESTCDAQGNLCPNPVYYEDFGTIVSQVGIMIILCEEYFLSALKTKS